MATHLSYEKCSLPTATSETACMRIDRITHNLFEANGAKQSNDLSIYCSVSNSTAAAATENRMNRAGQ